MSPQAYLLYHIFCEIKIHSSVSQGFLKNKKQMQKHFFFCIILVEVKDMWLLFAFGAAFFAGVTAILSKIGIRNTDSNVATAIRTVVVLLFSWLMVSELPMFSLKISSVAFRGNEIRFVFVGISAILLILLHWFALPLIIGLYILMSLVQAGFRSNKN